MHNAPSVSCLVGRSVMGHYLTLAFWCVSGLAGLLWLGRSSALGLEHAALVLAYAVGAWVSWRDGRALCAGRLNWTGQDWSLVCQGREMTGMAYVRLDGQSWMLIEFIGDDKRSVWLWPHRGVDGWQWQTLRQAVRAGALQRHA